MSFNWKAIIGKAAPEMSTLLSGPLAGVVTTELCSLFGIDSKVSDAEEQLSKIVKDMTADQMIQVVQLGNQLKVKFKEVDMDIFKEEISDRQASRLAHKDSKIPAILSVVVVVSWLILTLVVFLGKVPADALSLAMRALGTMDAALFVILYFWFGSSKGSHDKTETLNNTPK